jgi:hypothetical protein
MRKTALLGLLSITISLGACVDSDTARDSGDSDAKSQVPADLGPTKYDASGTLPCSVGSAAYDQACGFRVVRKPGGAAEIWIANIAYNDRVKYRVLDFAEGEFTTRDDAALDYSRDSDNWLVNADGREYYKIPDAVIVGG